MVDVNEMSAEANPWHPITDPVDLKYLGKLSEEVWPECIS